MTKEEKRLANARWLASRKVIFVSKEIGDLIGRDAKEDGRTPSKQAEWILSGYYEHFLEQDQAQDHTNH
jgi:hypothetical protein